MRDEDGLKKVAKFCLLHIKYGHNYMEKDPLKDPVFFDPELGARLVEAYTHLFYEVNAELRRRKRSPVLFDLPHPRQSQQPTKKK